MPIQKIGRVFPGAFKGIAKIGGKLFKSKIFDFASVALCFIPGLNGVGLIARALRVLGSARKIQNFLRTGFQVFRNLVQEKFRLGDAVRRLNVSPFHPLGKLAKLAEGLSGPRRMTDILSAIAPRAGQFEKAIGRIRELQTSLRKMNLGSLRMPNFTWPIEQLSASMASMAAPLLVKVSERVPQFPQRLEQAQRMLLRILSPPEFEFRIQRRLMWSYDPPIKVQIQGRPADSHSLLPSGDPVIPEERPEPQR